MQRGWDQEKLNRQTKHYSVEMFENVCARLPKESQSEFTHYPQLVHCA